MSEMTKDEIVNEAMRLASMWANMRARLAVAVRTDWTGCAPEEVRPDLRERRDQYMRELEALLREHIK